MSRPWSWTQVPRDRNRASGAAAAVRRGVARRLPARRGGSASASGLPRAEEYVDLGVHVAVDWVLTPRILGGAARSGRYEPQSLKRGMALPGRVRRGQAWGESDARSPRYYAGSALGSRGANGWTSACAHCATSNPARSCRLLPRTAPPDPGHRTRRAPGAEYLEPHQDRARADHRPPTAVALGLADHRRSDHDRGGRCQASAWEASRDE